MAQNKMSKIKDLDLYLLLEVSPEATEKEIKKAYRKKSLKCHPDKNPDDPNAATTFHQLSEALAILSDETARKAYDNVLKARKANELRNRQLDEKRRKLKDSLEAREVQAANDERNKVKLLLIQVTEKSLRHSEPKSTVGSNNVISFCVIFEQQLRKSNSVFEIYASL